MEKNVTDLTRDYISDVATHTPMPDETWQYIYIKQLRPVRPMMTANALVTKAGTNYSYNPEVGSLLE